MEKWIEDNKQRLLRLQTTGIDAEEKLSLELIAEIERLEMDNALVRGGNEEKRNQIESLEATLATYKAVVEKISKKIKTIKSCYDTPGSLKVPVILWEELDEILLQALQKISKEQPLCQYCGKPENDSKHVRYGPDLDNPVKHEFVALQAAKEGE